MDFGHLSHTPNNGEKGKNGKVTFSAKISLQMGSYLTHIYRRNILIDFAFNYFDLTIIFFGENRDFFLFTLYNGPNYNGVNLRTQFSPTNIGPVKTIIK